MGEFLAQGGDALDERGGAEIGELLSERALQVSAQFVTFTA